MPYKTVNLQIKNKVLRNTMDIANRYVNDTDYSHIDVFPLCAANNVWNVFISNQDVVRKLYRVSVFV